MYDSQYIVNILFLTRAEETAWIQRRAGTKLMRQKTKTFGFSTREKLERVSFVHKTLGLSFLAGEKRHIRLQKGNFLAQDGEKSPLRT